MELTFYYSNDCGHCRRFSKTLEKIEQERQHVRIIRVEYEPSIHTEVNFIPTVIVSHGGRELGRFSSALAKKVIDNWFNQLEDYIKQHLEDEL
jgi:thioredoxin-like negative regulator of GroEL